MQRWTRLTGWRRIANAMWRAPNDPQIFGMLDIEAGPMLRFLEAARHRGEHLTPTHLVGRAVACALEATPALNVQIRRGRARPRASIDVFFQTAVAGGKDLSGITIRDASRKSAAELAAELRDRATAMKQGRDGEFARTKRMTDAMPISVLRGALALTSFLAQDLRLALPGLGVHRDPFGSAMVTSVGMFGLPQGFAPLAWMYDVPLLVLVGEITPKPVVVGDRVEPRPVLPITATIDHRYVDGAHVGSAMKAFRAYLAAPGDFEPAPRHEACLTFS